MKSPRFVIFCFGLLVSLAFPAHAGSGQKGAKAGKGTARALARFDRDHDGALNHTESERLSALYSAISALDSDRDGKLSESEVAAAKIRVRRKK